MIKRFWTILFLSIAVFGMAQDASWMEADRPGAATGPGIVPIKGVMWETGFETEISNGDYAFVLPTTLFRFGISQHAELRLEYEGALVQNKWTKQWGYEPEPLSIGTKVRIFDGSETHRWIPKTALMVNLEVPITAELAKTMIIDPSIYALFENEVTNWFSIGYNLGILWNGKNPTPKTFVALCLGFNITDDIGAFAESYNYITGYGSQLAGECYVDAGFDMMVHERVQLDLYASIYAQDPKQMSSVGIGVAWRMH